MGLSVARSFQFQANAYPGYEHARTLGNVEGGGGWRGNDRPARTYVFQVKDGHPAPLSKSKDASNDDDDDDDDE